MWIHLSHEIAWIYNVGGCKGVFLGDKYEQTQKKHNKWLQSFRAGEAKEIMCERMRMCDEIYNMCPCGDVNKLDENDFLNVQHLAFIQCLTSHTHVTPLAASLQPRCTSTTGSASLLFPSNCGRNVGFGERRGFYVCHLCACMHWLPNDYMCTCLYIRFFMHECLRQHGNIHSYMDLKLMQPNQSPKLTHAKHQTRVYFPFGKYISHTDR